MNTETYFHIDSDEVCRVAEGVLGNAGLNFKQAYSRRFGSSTHQVVYDLTDLYIPSEVDHGLMPRIIFTNSYKKESAFVIGVGMLRGICTNGLVFGTSFFNEKIIHRAGPTAEQKFAQLQTKIGNAIDIVGDMTDHVDEMRNLRFSEQDWLQIVGNLPIHQNAKRYAFHAKLRDSVRDQDKGNDAWSLYNVVNESLRRAVSPLQFTKQNAKLMDEVILLAQDVAKAA